MYDHLYHIPLANCHEPPEANECSYQGLEQASEAPDEKAACITPVVHHVTSWAPENNCSTHLL